MKALKIIAQFVLLFLIFYVVMNFSEVIWAIRRIA